MFLKPAVNTVIDAVPRLEIATEVRAVDLDMTRQPAGVHIRAAYIGNDNRLALAGLNILGEKSPVNAPGGFSGGARGRPGRSGACTARQRTPNSADCESDEFHQKVLTPICTYITNWPLTIAQAWRHTPNVTTTGG